MPYFKGELVIAAKSFKGSKTLRQTIDLKLHRARICVERQSSILPTCMRNISPSRRHHNNTIRMSTYGQRSSSESSESSTSSSSTTSSAYDSRYSLDVSSPPRVEILRCSRCAKCVETISRGRSDGSRRVSTDDASANGMVRFGHNLYYCNRCARMVGYK